MIRALRVQVASVLVGLITLVLIAEGVWAVTLIKQRHRPTPKPAPKSTTYLPARLAGSTPSTPDASDIAPATPESDPDVLDFSNPGDYTGLAPQLEFTDVETVAPANG